METQKTIIGRTFNGIKVLGLSFRNKRGLGFYKCKCHCGTECILVGTRVVRGRTTGCGCFFASKNHGLTKTHEYGIWAAMKTRCLNRKSKAFDDYGGRGITVCERWKDFKNFYSDMGRRPSRKHSIERIDNSKGYCPENCCWSTPIKQTRNKRNNVMMTHGGKTLCLTDWSAATGISIWTIRARLKRKWPTETALTTPVRIQKTRRK